MRIRTGILRRIKDRVILFIGSYICINLLPEGNIVAQGKQVDSITLRTPKQQNGGCRGYNQSYNPFHNASFTLYNVFFGHGQSRSQTVDDPFSFLPTIPDSVVQPVRSSLKKFEFIRFNTVTAP